MLTYAIGDVHGDLKKLDRTIDACLSHADGRTAKFVLIGDYIDRGPDSKGVIDRVMALEKNHETVPIKGNHEEMVLLAVGNSDPAVRFWIDHGGVATLNSFRIGEIDARLIPEKYLDWMRARPLFHDDGLRFFVHAGVDLTKPLHGQSEDVMLWTREPFPEGAMAERYVVHGHTPAEIPDIRPGRLNIDTGCGFGGPLTAAVFDETQKQAVAFIFDGRLIDAASFAMEWKR